MSTSLDALAQEWVEPTTKTKKQLAEERKLEGLARGRTVTRAAFISSREEEPPPSRPLSPREIEVLEGVAAGLTTAMVAKTLFISELTVKTHLARISRALGSSSTVGSVAAAFRSGQLR